VDTALKAANLIGNGLYGVDLKETENGIVVIEVNDNPSIDSGVEDQVLGDALYEQIMEEFLVRIEAGKTPASNQRS
ncbi:MAG: RimK family alpha-L-glutamate ligase, partial [Sedimenticola sp.]|nr:RimK family alpha-L-glutamate ligase [Sedimenticola sp.]